MKKIFLFLWRYKIWTAIFLIVFGLIAFSIYKKTNSAPDLQFDTVKRETIIDTVSESGNLIYEGQANINALAEGVVDQIYVKNGDYVFAGQNLISCQSLATDQEKSTALASLMSATTSTNTAHQTKLSLQAAAETAQKTVYDAQRALQIAESGLRHKDTNPATNKTYKQIEVDSAQKAVEAAEENLAAANLKLSDADQTIRAAEEAEAAAQLNYDNKTAFLIKAPSSGTVSNLSLNIGDKVSPVVGGGKTILVITKSKKLLFTSSINENDITKLRIDQAAELTIDAIKDKTFKGRLVNIDTVGTNTAGVITYNVYFNIETPDETMLSGMSGTVEVEVARQENVLTVVNAAIKPYQDGKAVQVIDQSKPSPKNKPALKYITVKTGIKSIDRTEITEGLTEGMEIVISNSGNQFKSNLFGG